MKHIFLYTAFICLAVLFTSCKKDNVDPDSTDAYISFKWDGIQKNYKAKAVAVQATINGIYGLGLTAYKSDSSLEMLFLDISQKDNAITTGTYIDPGTDNGILIVAGGYNPGTTDDAKLYAAGLQDDDNPRLHITITSKTDKRVSGTFYGTFYDDGGDGSGTAACTDGKFSLPLY